MEKNPFDTHDWPRDTLEPICRQCGCRLIVPYGDITKEAATPCPGGCLEARNKAQGE